MHSVELLSFTQLPLCSAVRMNRALSNVKTQTINHVTKHALHTYNNLKGTIMVLPRGYSF